MRNNIVCATAFFVAISSVSAIAAVIRVPADQPTIQAGINAAGTNDTVMVSSGTYNGGLWCNKAITLISELGPDVTSLVHSGVTLFLSYIRPDTFYVSGFELISTADRAIASDFSNFHVDNCHFPQSKFATIHFSGNSGTIRNCRFSDNTPDPFAWNAAIFVDNLGKTRLERNVFYSLKFPYVFFTTAERVECINNTVVNCDGGFNVSNGYGSPGSIYNNIFWSIAGSAIVTGGQGPQIDYNLYFANGVDVSGGSPGINSVFADPILADTAFWDFAPLPGSPVVDAGHPGPEYNDSDNTRNDIGAIPGEKSFPRILNVEVVGEDRFHVVSHVPLFAWGFLDTINVQSAYEIEVGTDQDWSVAEQWATAPVQGSDTTAIYSGALLMDGHMYFLRVRVSNGIEWSQWRTISFRMNSAPSVPILLRPIAGAETVSMATTLVIGNSADAQFDTLSYSFEVYADPDMMSLVDSLSGVPQGNDSTLRELSETLPPDADYWWRSRAFDGREYSAWSNPEMFHARGSRAFVVPGDYATIPEAVISVSAYDTIFVQPGTYSIKLDLSIKQARLISTTGPTETILIHEAFNSPIITTGSSGISRTEIVGFTLIAPSGAAAISVMSGTPTIRDNIFRDSPTPYGIPPIAVNGGNPLITHNLFRDNQAMAAVGVYGGSARIINNTFIGNLRGFFTLTAQGEAINNIVIHSTEYGIYGDFSRRDYNNVWLNNPDYGSGSAGPHDISSDPAFVDTAAGNFELLPNSPCFNAGDPDPVYNDPDGTRSDMGAYPFSGPLPIGLSLYIHSEV